MPMGVLHYIEAVDEKLLSTQSHQKKDQKDVYFQKKTTNFAAANNKN